MIFTANLFRSKDGDLAKFATTEIEADNERAAPRSIVYDGKRFRRFFELGQWLPVSYLDEEDDREAVAATLRKWIADERKGK